MTAKTAPQSICPAPDILRAVALGDPVDEATFEFIARHLEACDQCSAAAAAVSGDAFLDRRQAAGRKDEAAESTKPDGPGASNGTRPDGQPAVSTPDTDAVPPELADNPDYEIVRELGRGGMGVVYLARNRLMGREEVLKVMGPAVMALPGAADRFRREIQSAAHLDHRNIVRAYAARQFGDLLALAMEYVPGEDVGSLVKVRGPRPVQHACYYAYQVALGLQHAHERGMVHRDIKPANLLVHRAGKRHTVKVLDFGLAKVTSEAGQGPELTGSGQMMGTPLYMAPEQARDAAAADIRADVYSLGCTLYYLLAGHPPLAGGVIAVLSDERPRPLSEVRPDVSDDLARVVGKMMAKDPAQRYQTPAEVAAVLTPFLKPDASPVGPGGGAVGPIVEPLVPGPADPWGELTLSEPTPAPQPGRAPAGGRRVPRRAWPAIVAGGLLAGLLAVLAGGVLRVKTKDGTIVLEKLPPDAEVLVDGEAVTVTRNGDQATVTAVRGGPHRLKVVQAGKEILASDLTVTVGGEPVRVRIEPPPVRPVVKEDPPASVFDASGKAKPPEGSRLAAAKAKVRATYKDELGRTKPEDRKSLAKTLAEKAGAVRADDPDQRYAMLDLAGELVAEAGDFGAALGACDEIYKSFAVDPVRVKTDMLKAASVNLFFRGEQGLYDDLADAALGVGFEAVAADRYEQAQTLARVAGQAAVKTSAPHYGYQSEFLAEEAARVGTWYERVKAAVAATNARPADPRANAEAGKFLCLAKNEWAKGLALLSGSEDPVLVALAEQETKKPTKAADQIALGNLWWESAEKVAADEKTDFKRRARHWYLKGLAGTEMSARPEVAAKLTPRIDSVPTRPVTVRIRLERFKGNHTLRLSNDGVQHSSRHGGLRVRVNHLWFPLAWKGGDQSHRENAGAGRFLPDATDFSDARVVREEGHRWGTVSFGFAADSFTVHALNSTADANVNLDLTVTFQANGFTSATRMSGLWDVKGYKLDATKYRDDGPADWNEVVAGEPLVRVTRDRIDFAACQKPPLDDRRAPPVAGLPHDWFGLVGTSEWVTPAGKYEVHTLSDDGVRVFIDDQKVIDNWKSQSGSRSQAELRLGPGTHRVRVEYFQTTGPARLQFALRRVGD